MPLLGTGQVVPHVPQLAGSIVVSTHDPLQFVKPGRQCAGQPGPPQPPTWQTPASHSGSSLIPPLPQALPPQQRGSVASS
jgi:hypothetical protein